MAPKNSKRLLFIFVTAVLLSLLAANLDTIDITKCNCIKRDHTPTRQQLTLMVVPDLNATLQIKDRISYYDALATFLLNDNNGVILERIRQDYRRTRQIIDEIFDLWIRGEGLKPTWGILVETLKMSHLNALANEIESILEFCANESMHLECEIVNVELTYTDYAKILTFAVSAIFTSVVLIVSWKGITDIQMDSSTSSEEGQSCSEEPLYSLEADAPEKALPKPRTGTPQLKCLKTFASEVVIILHPTVSPSEKPAVLKDMSAPELESDPALDPPVAGPINLLGVPNKIILGMFGGYKCALVQTEQGEKCKKEIEDALERLPNTQCVIALGMAYGNTKYKFGDVLVSKTIRGVVNPKFNGERIHIRSSEYDSVPVLEYLSNTFARDLHNWKDFQCSTTGRKSKVYAGDVVSVSWLISSKSIRDRLLDNFPDAIGGEMEGHELVKIKKDYNQKNHPRQLGVIIIKGAADYADENKQGGKKWQYTAARAATHFAKYQLECTNGALFDKIMHFCL